jgi:anti-sigma B factor antagonist
MEINKKTENGITTIYLAGNLLGEHANGPVLEEVRQNLDKGVKKVIIVLKGVKFINSTGFGMFMSALARVRNAGGEMILAEIPENILRLLTVMKLDTIFLISPTEQDASERLSLIK